MADAVQVPDHRHTGFGFKSGNERLAAPRNNDVNVLHRLDEFTHKGTVRGGHNLHAVGIEFHGGKRLSNKSGKDFVGFKGFRAPAQNDGVAGL